MPMRAALIALVPVLAMSPATAAEDWRRAAPVYRNIAYFNSLPAGDCGALHFAVEEGHKLITETPAGGSAAFAFTVFLDVADAAADRGCLAEARALYREVLEGPGAAEEAVRARAGAALAALPPG